MSSPLSTHPMRQLTVLFLSNPRLWSHWPFLPMIRRKPGRENELGLVFDALHAADLPGLSCTVYLSNLFMLPSTLEEFLQLPRETYDTPEEVADALWTVD
jgi:hypothetical protein